MDIVLTKKEKISRKRLLTYCAAAALVLVPSAYFLFYSQSEFSVDEESIVVSEVKRGRFTVSVRGTGVLVPSNIQWASASVEAKVEKRYVKAGDTVKKGDLLVELSNPLLNQQLAEAQWELEASLAESKANAVIQETTLLGLESTLLESKLQYENNVNEYDLYVQLSQKGVAPQLDFQRAKLRMDQSKQRWSFNQQQLEKMRGNLKTQEDVRLARVKQSKKRVERIQREVDELKVVANMDSIVLDIPIEEGQRVRAGDNIAKLADQYSLIANLQIPEVQVQDVKSGQKAFIDTRNSKISGVVQRVEPAVVNGTVLVEISFTEALPPDARPDLSVDGEIKVTDIDDTLFVDRPLFAQSKSQTSIYKLSENGAYAERADVSFGLGSVAEVQVVDGLAPGDKIVTSDPTRFERYSKIRIR